MVAVLMAEAGSGWGSVLGFAVVLAILGALPLLNARRSKTLAVALVLAGLLAVGAATVEAIYIPCPWEWKYLGLCR
jgi:hypothetical protein